MPEPSGYSKTTLMSMSTALLHLTSKEKIDELSQPAHLFAKVTCDRAKEAGISPAELSFALCKLLSVIAPKSFQPDITNLGIVTLAAIIAKKGGNQHDPRSHSTT